MSVGSGGTPRSSLDRYIRALEAAGLRHTIRGDHVQAECPTHPDQRPSLSADYKASEGKTVFKCQGGCDSSDVLTALDLTWPMLFDNYEEPEEFAERRARERAENPQAPRQQPRRRRPAERPKAPAAPKGRLPKPLTEVEPRPLGEWSVTTTYDYCDMAGVVVHQEVRHQRPIEVVDEATGEKREKVEKRFTQRWPDNTPGGGWLEKTPAGFVPVLYRLPDVAEWIAEERPIWLCEGAKDAERFLELGEAATTNPSGASNFKAEQAASLSGAHVQLVVDHDLAGYRRGLTVGAMLKGTAASVRFFLPITQGRHEDASDHFDAGHGVDDFVEVTPGDLEELARVADAEDAVLRTSRAAAEASAQMERGRAAAKDSQRAEGARFAARWAAEAGKYLVRATRALEEAQDGPSASAERMERLTAAVRACQASTVAAYAAAEVDVPEELAAHLVEPTWSPAAAEDLEQGRTTGDIAAVIDLVDDELDADDDDNVRSHPTRGRQSTLPAPTGDVPMSRGTWRYELGGNGRRPRGVYQYDDGQWVKVAPLPYLHARIVSRDGYGRPMGTYYLVSALPDSVKVTIGHDELSRHTWPNMLSLAVSHDDKILKAATTALIFAAEEETELVEATPRVTEDGKIALPVPETLPHGYLATSGLERDEALRVWANMVDLIAESPRMALVLGAAAFGPFVAALDRQPHIVSLHGDMAQGKSVTMRAAASIWGHPGSKSQAGVCESWNQSKLAPTSFLGELGVLPAFFDEIGMAGNLSAADWGKRIFDICEGASRGRPAANGRPGFVRGRSWYGILVSAGNSRLMDGIGAGGMAGTQRRVVELSTPFTHSQSHSDAIEELYPQAYGHLGTEILERHSAETIGPFLERAAELMGEMEFESPVAQEIVKHLRSHIAGAALIDEVCGTGNTLTAAATIAALEYLEDWEAPLHDADRILDAIHDSLFQEPACWPTVAQHLENTQAPNFDGGGSEIARHGVALKTKGLVANDQGWVAVFPNVWEALCEELGVDSDVACRELTKREVLIRQGSSHKPGARNHTSVIKVGRATKRFYKLVYPEIEEPDDQPPPAAEPGPQEPTPAAPEPAEDQVADVAPQLPVDEPVVTAPVTAPEGQVTAVVTAANPPLTCEVTAVTAVTAPSSHVGAHGRVEVPEPVVERLGPDEPRPPCVVCGVQAGQLVDGRPLHLGPCFEEVDRAEFAEASATAPAPATDGDVPSPATSSGSGPTATKPGPKRGTTTSREARFTAPAACLTAEGIHLADGSVRPWPETVAHLGDLAILTGREHLRLGWGGGEDRLPDQGQIWLYADALERLGLPTEAPALPDKALTKRQRARENQKAYAKLDDHPMVAGALEAGWQLGQGGHLDVWTRIWHPEFLPQGALLVGLPWHRIEGVALFEDQPAAGELARRLLLFAQNVGVAYRITTAATGLDLIDHHRPPRRDASDDLGAGRRRVALIRNTGADLPPWRKKTNDARFNGLEQDFSWWRTWDQLPESEKARRYVHGYDRNASYLVPWRSIELGVEDLIHRTGDAAAWDGKERPGYYLVDGGWEWPEWGLPDPATAAGARVSNGRVWVTTHTLKQLAAHGVKPQVHESYTWGTTARYLEGPGTVLAQARTDLTPKAEDPAAAAVLATVKSLYSSTVGKLAENDHSPDFHLWRPDWRDHVISATRTAILHTVTKAQEISGEHPLVVDRDAVFYASDNPDPIAAWPGDPAKLGTALGSWKPIGSADLAEWGPEHLVKRTGRWHYADAVDALGAPGEVNGDG